MVRVALVPSRTDRPVELHPLPTPALHPAIAAAVLVPGIRRFKEVDINVLRVCIAHVRE